MALVRQGKLDRERVNRGLGLALSKRFRQNHHGYRCTDSDCNCLDSTQRWVTCKHQVAVAILKVAREIERGQRSKDTGNNGAELPGPVQQRRQRAAVPGSGRELPGGRQRRPRTDATKRKQTRKGMGKVPP